MYEFGPCHHISEAEQKFSEDGHLYESQGDDWMTKLRATTLADVKQVYTPRELQDLVQKRALADALAGATKTG